jgi:hypothetical protein
MKKLYVLILLLVAGIAHAQISVQGTENGSVTITPKGLQGKSNSMVQTGNLALGSNALKNNIVGVGTGTNNTAVGDSAMFANTTGFVNTAFGVHALQNNTTAPSNTAVGAYALKTNSTGSHNTGIGNLSLYYNTSGFRNTSIGNTSLFDNTTGAFNVAVGNWAVRGNKVGNYNTGLGSFALLKSIGEANTAIGSFALRNDSLGTLNTAMGYAAGLTISSGSQNTFLGFGTDASAENLSNSMALGFGAIVNATNKVRIGDANITVIEGQVAWSNPSDRRLKEKIDYTSRLGLDFITGLKTVSYNYIADKNKTRYDGFIAQDIEKLMVDLGVPFSGLKKSEDGMLSLAYSDFVIPLVNAIQEQQKQIEDLKKQVQESNDLKSRLEQLEARLLN